MKLSIIIPVYNVEQWIRRCLESVYSQNLNENDFEIVLVNDGTKDKSIEVAEAFVNTKTNVKIIHQENKGLSAARNTGLKYAQGDYVWFVDSDDCIEPDSVNSLLEHAVRENLDVLCFGVNLLFTDGRKEQYKISYEEGVMNGAAFIERVGMPPAAWCAFYRRNFLTENELKFRTGIFFEDQEFTPRTYYLAKRIEFIPTIVYNYSQREGSIMKSFGKRKQKSLDYLTVCDSLYKFIKNRVDENENAYKVLVNRLNFDFSQSLRFYSISFFPLRKYKEKNYYPLQINDLMSKNDKIKYRIINFSLPLYLFLCKLLRK